MSWRFLLYLAAFIAFCLITLRVPPDGRVIGYYVEGLVVLACLTFLAFGRSES